MTSASAERTARGIIQPRTSTERRFIIGCLLWTTFLLLLDQGTKILVERTMYYGESRPVIDGFFNITYVTNKGAAWGMFSGYGWLLLGIGIAVLVAAIVFLRYLTEGYIERYAAIFTIAAGVIGNSIDRMWRGEVVDFFDVYFRNWHWPVFNIADCAICIGVGIFLLSALFRPARAKSNTP